MLWCLAEIAGPDMFVVCVGDSSIVIDWIETNFTKVDEKDEYQLSVWMYGQKMIEEVYLYGSDVKQYIKEFEE